MIDNVKEIKQDILQESDWERGSGYLSQGLSQETVFDLWGLNDEKGNKW